ncbi:hypothetical protein [Kitasatospora viridis]|uniref:Uncharacterized protein n=1 Tax=Kitasatospora viridis TaxID=281105 RepID=A0A561ULH6_9ACTN|nr:hypothetical protein [Kitasatospora viridis]TWG00209.1 hypothetical protein FHX73_114081 [Kitasatospora viridis]
MTSGSGPDLVGAVVQALARAVGQTGGNPAAVLGADLLGQAWQRLLAQPRWAPAADQLTRTPNDPQTLRNLSLAVGELLLSDPLLAEALRTRWAPFVPPAQFAGTVAGRVPAPGRRGRNAAIAAGVLVVVGGLIALGQVFGSNQLAGHHATPLGQAQVQQVLPVLADLPANGWSAGDDPADVHAPDCSGGGTAQLTAACKVITDVGTVSFKDPGGTAIGFSVFATGSSAQARQVYDALLSAGTSESAASASPIAFPTVGERSVAYASAQSVEVITEVGTTVLDISYATGRTDAGYLAPYARLLVSRSQQAQDGKTPDATVR